MTFDEILKTMLSELDNGKSVDDIINTMVANLQLSEESISAVREAVSGVDKFLTTRDELKGALKLGASREEWLDSKVDGITSELNDEEKIKADSLISAIKDKGLDLIVEE